MLLISTLKYLGTLALKDRQDENEQESHNEDLMKGKSHTLIAMYPSGMQLRSSSPTQQIRLNQGFPPQRARMGIQDKLQDVCHSYQDHCIELVRHHHNTMPSLRLHQ
jgi:hypothetical protein